MTKECLFCGKTFTLKRFWHKFCTSKCRWKAWDKKNPRVRNKAAAAATIFLLMFAAVSNCSADQLKASWYSNASLKEEGTWKTSKGVMANGQLFNENAFTCATRMYNLGTVLLVRNIENSKSVRVVVTDKIGKRFTNKRIDLSKRAFREIADLEQGIVPISVESIR